MRKCDRSLPVDAGNTEEFSRRELKNPAAILEVLQQCFQPLRSNPRNIREKEQIPYV
jgi:hypothetical protein